MKGVLSMAWPPALWGWRVRVVGAHGFAWMLRSKPSPRAAVLRRLQVEVDVLWRKGRRGGGYGRSPPARLLLQWWAVEGLGYLSGPLNAGAS